MNKLTQLVFVIVVLFTECCAVQARIGSAESTYERGVQANFGIVARWKIPNANGEDFFVDGQTNTELLATLHNNDLYLYKKSQPDFVDRVSMDTIMKDQRWIGYTADDILIDTAHNRVLVLIVNVSASGCHSTFLAYSLNDKEWSIDSTIETANVDYPSRTTSVPMYTVNHQYRFVAPGAFRQYYGPDGSIYEESYSTVTFPDDGKTYGSNHSMHPFFYQVVRRDLNLCASMFELFIRPSTTVRHQQDIRNSEVENYFNPNYPMSIPLIEPRDFTDNGKGLLTNNYAIEYKHNVPIKPLPDGIMLNERFFVVEDQVSKNIFLRDIQLNSDVATLFSTNDSISHHFITSDRHSLIVSTRDSLFLISLPTQLASYKPEPDFTTEFREYAVGDTVHFINLSYPIGEGPYFWTFGDGSSATADFPDHMYLKGGNYLVHMGILSGPNDTLWSTTVLSLRIDAPDYLLSFHQYGTQPVSTLRFDAQEQDFSAGFNKGALVRIPTTQNEDVLPVLPSFSDSTLLYAGSWLRDGKPALSFAVQRRDSLVYAPNDEVNFYHDAHEEMLERSATNTGGSLLLGRPCFDTFNAKNPLDAFGGPINPVDTFAIRYDVAESKNDSLLVVGVRKSISTRFLISKDLYDDEASMSITTGNLYRFGAAGKQPIYRYDDDLVRATTSDLHAMHFDTTSRAVFSVCISPDGTKYLTSENSDMLVAPNPSLIIEYDLASGRETRRWNISSNCVRYLPDGSGFVASDGVHSLIDGQLIKAFDLGDPDQFEVLPDGHRIIVLKSSLELARLMDLNDPNYMETNIESTRHATCLKLSNDGSMFAVGTREGAVYVLGFPALSASVGEISNSNIKLDLRPLPVTQQLSVKSSAGGRYSVVDVLGNVVREGTIQNGTCLIDCSALVNGMYVFSLQILGARYSRSFIVSHD